MNTQVNYWRASATAEKILGAKQRPLSKQNSIAYKQKCLSLTSLQDKICDPVIIPEPDGPLGG